MPIKCMTSIPLWKTFFFFKLHLLIHSLFALSSQVVCRKYREFEIPAALTGLTKYLEKAYQQDEFRYTCPNDVEILLAYHSVAKYLNK